MKKGHKKRRIAIDHYQCNECKRWFESEPDIQEHYEKLHLKD